MPYRPQHEAEDAVQFVKRMREQDQKVATTMNKLHEKRTDSLNDKRKEPTPLMVGSKVWYRPEPQPSRDKLGPT